MDLIDRLKIFTRANEKNLIDIFQNRVVTLIFFIVACYFVLAFSLFKQVVFSESTENNKNFSAQNIIRKEIVDRNGVLLATNLLTASVYANPRKMIDRNEAIDKLAKAMPSLDKKKLASDIKSNKGFIWIKRNVTPKEQYEINALGIPGVFFQEETRRVYPFGNALSHVLGYVGLDNKGLAGIEQYYDGFLLKINPLQGGYNPDNLQLSIDIRAQNIVQEELVNAVNEFSAIGGIAILANIKTGEILALSSLPDFNPTKASVAKSDQIFNRATLGVYEMGSTLKAITLAMALEKDAITLKDVYNVSSPIKVARFSITDYHPKGGWLTVPEIFMYSSNIGTAKIAMEVGKLDQKKFLKDLGLLSKIELELPEMAKPIYPSDQTWSDVSLMTISYGYGIAITPMHLMKAYSILLNDGYNIPLTLRKRAESLDYSEYQKILSDQTSNEIKKLLRLVVEHGTGRKSEVIGYYVGGKTGTANKSTNGKYSQNSRLSSFIAAFPMNDPEYLVLAMLDEPKGNSQTGGYATAGIAAAPITGKIISRIGPLFGIKPIADTDIIRDLHLDYHIEVDDDTL